MPRYPSRWRRARAPVRVSWAGSSFRRECRPCHIELVHGYGFGGSGRASRDSPRAAAESPGKNHRYGMLRAARARRSCGASGVTAVIGNSHKHRLAELVLPKLMLPKTDEPRAGTDLRFVPVTALTPQTPAVASDVFVSDIFAHTDCWPRRSSNLETPSVLTPAIEPAPT